MIIVYITCEDFDQAKKIGLALLKKRLAACINIIPETQPYYWWPPKANKLDEAAETESLLLVKTMTEKYDEIEEVVLKMHSYESPAIFSVKADRVEPKFLAWIRGELAGEKPVAATQEPKGQ